MIRPLLTLAVIALALADSRPARADLAPPLRNSSGTARPSAPEGLSRPVDPRHTEDFQMVRPPFIFGSDPPERPRRMSATATSQIVLVNTLDETILVQLEGSDEGTRIPPRGMTYFSLPKDARLHVWEDSSPLTYLGGWQWNGAPEGTFQILLEGGAVVLRRQR